MENNIQNINKSTTQHHTDHAHQEDENDDEKKMEMFFSLIRSFKEARDRRRQELQDEVEKTNKTRKLNHFLSPSSSFVRQDFTVDTCPNHLQYVRVSHDHYKPRNHEEKEEDKKDDVDLNLKLSL